MHDFLLSLLNVVCEMAPYLLLGFFIAEYICAYDEVFQQVYYQETVRP